MLMSDDPHPPVTFETVRQIALGLPGVEEGTSYGTPAFRVKKKFLCRLREEGDTIVVRLDFNTRDALMKSDPDVFYITDHYAGYPAVLVRLAVVDPGALREVLEEAWRQQAPKRLVAEWDENED
jgi:hypothetical protein